jgi:hypothetical protein
MSSAVNLASPWHQWLVVYLGVALDCPWPIWAALYWNTRYTVGDEQRRQFGDELYTFAHDQLGEPNWIYASNELSRQALVHSDKSNQHLTIVVQYTKEVLISISSSWIDVAMCELYCSVTRGGWIVLWGYTNLVPRVAAAAPLAHDFRPQLALAVAQVAQPRRQSSD